jgi:hypothetical protein
MIVAHTITDSFGHFTIRPYTAEIEEWLNANITHGSWWVAGLQQFQAFICIENELDCMWFILRWS